MRAPRAFSSGNSAMTSGSGSSQSARPSAVAHRLSQASIAVVNAVAITVLPHRRSSPPTLTLPRRRCQPDPGAELKALYYGHSRVRGMLVRNWRWMRQVGSRKVAAIQPNRRRPCRKRPTFSRS